MIDPEEALTGLRFALSHPITLAIPPDNNDLFQMPLNILREFDPLNTEDAEKSKGKPCNRLRYSGIRGPDSGIGKKIWDYVIRAASSRKFCKPAGYRVPYEYSTLIITVIFIGCIHNKRGEIVAP